MVIISILYVCSCIYTTCRQVILSAYEDCLLEMNASSASSVHHLFDQPKCKKHISVKNKILLNDTIFIPSTCVIGTRHAKVSGSNAVIERSLFERRDAIINNHLQSEWDIGSEFVDSLLSKGYTNVHILGDSVTVQFAHFFSCDAKRQGIEINRRSTFWNNMYNNAKAGGADYMKSLSGAGVLRVFSQRLPDFKCMSSKCENLEAGVQEDTVSMIMKAANLTLEGRTLIIFNAGLHISSPTHKFYHQNEFRPKVLRGLANGLVDAAKLLEMRNNSRLVFRETSSQHFTFRKDGSFETPNLWHSRSKPYCRYPIQPAPAFVTDAIVKQYLREQQQNDSSLVLWQDFYNISMGAVDLHNEILSSSSTDNHIDCTHYLYIPFYFSNLVFGKSLLSLA